MSVLPYSVYRDGLIKCKATHIPSEEEYNRQYGITDEPKREILLITPRNKMSKVPATLQSHIENETVPKPKKKYAPRISRKGMTQDQIRARKAENVRNYKAREKQKRIATTLPPLMSGTTIMKH